MTRTLVRSIGVAQAVALYVGAVVGAGVLILPGAAATIAGPGSFVAWLFDALLGIPLALTFAALAGRYPDAGGVASFTARAYGGAAGAVVGWFYFFAAATGQVVVPLTGAYYAAPFLGLGAQGTTALAAGLLGLATLANLRGLRTSGRLQIVLSGGVAAMLATAVAAAVPRMRAEHLVPFVPHGWPAVGKAGVFIFFAFCGWEAIAQLSEEFADPAHDVPRATLWSVAIISALYVGTAVAVVATGSYGTQAADRVAVARLLGAAFGGGAEVAAVVLALVITLGTTNAFIAGTSRLGYALARDGAFPGWLARLDPLGVPQAAVAAVGLYAGAGLLISDLVGWGAETLLVVPNVLAIATYVVGCAAGVKLLAGAGRAAAAIGCLLSLGLLAFAGAGLVLIPLVAAVAIAYRARRGRGPHIIKAMGKGSG